MRSSRVARVLGTAVASVAAAAVITSTLVSPAAAVTEPLPGTATAQFFSGWLPYWRGSDTRAGRMELDRLVANAGPDGLVGEVNLFWAYSRYRELLANTSFEAGSTGWTRTGSGTTIAGVSSAAVSGERSLRVQRGAASGAGASTLARGVAPGTTYALEFYVRVPAGQSAQSIAPRIRWQQDRTVLATSQGTSRTISSGSGWVRLSMSAKAPSGANRATVVVASSTAGAAGQEFLVDAAGFVAVTGSGAVCVHDGSDVPAQECSRTALTADQQGQRDRLHDAGLKTFLSFTDEGSRRALARVIGSPAGRSALVAAQVRFVVDNGLDGVDLDYEGFAFSDGKFSWPTTKPAWAAYIRSLSAALHAKGKKLSMTVPAGYPVYGAGFNASSGYDVYAWKDTIGYVDRLRIMTYDYSWDTPGPIGPANWVDAVAGDAVEELGAVNAWKISLGVAAYGYNWATATTCPKRMKVRPTVTPTEALALYERAKAGVDELSLVPDSYRYDTVKGEYTFKYTQTGTAQNDSYTDPDTELVVRCKTSIREVWFQDARSHVDRALIAAKYQLAGIAMWAFGDERDATWTSLTAAAPSIKPYRPTISLLASPQVTYGQVATAGVTVTRPDSEPVPGVSVTFRWQPIGSTTWSVVGTVLTDDTGAATVRFKPTSSGTWQATTPPAVGRQSGTSGTMPTTVKSSVATAVRSVSSTGYSTLSTAVNNRVYATVKKDSAVQVAGRVLAARGQTVTLLRKRPDGVYQALTSGKVSSTGYYSFGVSTRTAGTYSYLVRSSATTTLAKGQSALVLLTVS